MLEAAAGVLQLADAEADNMEALTIDELLQSWGRGTIRKRFHELSMQVHPDKCSLPKADQVHTSPVSCSLPDGSDQMAVDLCPEKNSPSLGRQSPARAQHNLIACTEQLRSQALYMCMCLTEKIPRNLARDCTHLQSMCTGAGICAADEGSADADLSSGEVRARRGSA